MGVFIELVRSVSYSEEGTSRTATGVAAVSPLTNDPSSHKGRAPLVGEQKKQIDGWMVWQIVGLEAFPTLVFNSSGLTSVVGQYHVRYSIRW